MRKEVQYTEPTMKEVLEMAPQAKVRAAAGVQIGGLYR